MSRLIDELEVYNIADIDADASPNYYGFEHPNKSWYIMRETLATGADTYRYSKGDSDFAANWTNRASLTYATFSSVFTIQ